MIGGTSSKGSRFLNSKQQETRLIMIIRREEDIDYYNFMIDEEEDLNLFEIQ